MLRFIKYWLAAKTKYRVHSPYVFDFVMEVLEDQRWYYAFDGLLLLKKELSSDQRSLQVTDYGAGQGRSAHRGVGQIANSAVCSPRKGRFLFRLVKWAQPNHVLELGTSLGVSALYQYYGHSNAHFTTLEGCPAIAGIATENFKRFAKGEINQLVGPFEETLPRALQQIPSLDFVLFDGNHRKAPTLLYFEQCLAKTHNDSVFVFDDIHWSAEMEEAWNEIKNHPQVRLSIDVFDYGIVFFRKEQIEKEHFVLCPYKWKPFLV